MIKDHKFFNLQEKLIFQKVVLQPPFNISTTFDNEACFLYIIEGNTMLYSSTETVTLNKKEGLVAKCGNFLQKFLKNSEAQHCEAIGVHFYPEVLKAVFGDDLPAFLEQARKGKSVAMKKVVVDKLFNNYIESLQSYFDNPSVVNEELIKLKLRELIMLLIKTDDSNTITQILQDLFNPDQFQFREVIEGHLYDNLSVQELAGLSGLSTSSFKRRFKTVYDDTPANYIRTKKLERASKLLKSTNLRISEVAYDSGFNDLAHFSNTFTHHFGLSPSEYRAAS